MGKKFSQLEAKEVPADSDVLLLGEGDTGKKIGFAAFKQAIRSLFGKASATADGLMAKEDKARLDGLTGVPAGGTAGQVLKKTADGIAWQADANSTYGKATASADGLMSKEDFAKLAGLNNYTLPAAGTAIGGVKKGAAVADATAETVMAQLNALLASLRAAGVIAQG